ncbi:hypothetical protein AK812_SmicGene43280, partial [Symbiodinium microadriaticum]
MDWPSFPADLSGQLKQDFGQPSFLWHAVDDLESAKDLLRRIEPALEGELLTRLGRVLEDWRLRMEPVVKNQRRLAVRTLHGSLDMEIADSTKLQAAYKAVTSDQPLTLLPSLLRRERNASKFVDSTERANREKNERERYSILLCGFIKEADLPVISEIRDLADPEAATKRLFGARRSKTLRNRYRSWKRYSEWLKVTKARAWPSGVADLIDYAEELYQDGCGKTTLDSFQAALVVLETAGKVGETKKLSNDVLWTSTLRSLNADLVGAKPARRSAQLPTVATEVALELLVGNLEEPKYKRAVAWVVLLMMWASLRADDVQGILPQSMAFNGIGLIALLGKTKTTGLDRRTKEVKFFISREISLTGVDWLKIGCQIWKEYDKSRDYLVMEASPDWEKPTGRGVDPSALTLYLRQIFRGLRAPRYTSSGWRSDPRGLLFPKGLEAFWTGHAFRDWLPSLAAALGVPKPDRDFLGRWAINTSGGSSDYVRTSRDVVQRVQGLVASALVTGEPRPYLEFEALERISQMMNLIDGRGSHVRNLHDVLRKSTGPQRLGGKWPTFIPEADEAEQEGPHEPISQGRHEGDPECKYFISVSQNCGFRRLRLNGHCYVKAYKCSSVIYTNQMATDEEKRAAGARANSDLQYVLQEAGADLTTQFNICSLHTTLRRFQAIADTRAEARTAATRDFGCDANTAAGRQQQAAVVASWELAKEVSAKEVELRAEAKVLGQPRVLQVQERQAMIAAVTAVHGRLNESETPSAEYLALKAEECEINEPSASPLDCISAKRDNLESQLQSTVDAQGHIRITKVKHKLEVPVNSEHYRRIMKVEMYAWLSMASRFKAKVLGEKVSQLKIPTAQGSDQNAGFRPPWTTVLAYEFRLRKEAFRLVNEEGETLADALAKVCKDTELKEVYFTTPLALASAEGSVRKYFKGAGKDPKGGKSDQAASSKGDGKPHKGKASEGQGYGGKTPGVFAGFTLLSHTPDGRQICYAFNSAKGARARVNKDSTGGTDQKPAEWVAALLHRARQVYLLWTLKEHRSTCTTGDAANLCDPDAFAKSVLGTQLHKDGRNGTCHNAIVAVSDFVRGGLWLEDKDGDEIRDLNGEKIRGRMHPVVSVPFIFEARDRYHCTEAWEGHRLVMVAFTVPECEKLDKDDAAFVVDLGFHINRKAAEVDRAILFRPELCGNNGIPIKVSWAGSEGPLTDGFGLCSPSRWTPKARGARLGETARRFASAMHTLVKSFVLRVIPDPERSAMELVLGPYTSSPEKDMLQLRQQWVSFLGDSQGFDLLEVPERQPFFLPALARTAELLEDPDWEIVTQGNDNFCTGVPLGCEEVLPQVPQVFDFKYKSRTLDESEYDWDRSNYQSAREFETPLQEKFREEERLGRMFPTTLGALKEKFGSERIRIASLGAIGKPDGGARPIHDATHGVQVNNAIKIESQQAVPGPADLAYVVEEPIRRLAVNVVAATDNRGNEALRKKLSTTN